MLAGNPKIISVVFYAAAGGGEPVRDWLLKLDKMSGVNYPGRFGVN